MKNIILNENITSCAIVICLLKQKTNITKELFTNLDYFSEVLFWAKHSTRERLERNKIYFNLASIVDDAGSEVDKYMYKVRLKMLKNGEKGKNSLYKLLQTNDVGATAKWLVARWGNIFFNIVTNKKYKDYLNVAAYEINDFSNIDTLALIIQEEEEKTHQLKLEKQEITRWKKLIKEEQIGGELTKYGNTQMVLIF